MTSANFSKRSRIPTFYKYCSIFHFERIVKKKKKTRSEARLYMLHRHVYLELLLFDQVHVDMWLTLVMLNKLRSHAHF